MSSRIWIALGAILLFGLLLYLVKRKKTFLIPQSGVMEGVILGISKGLRTSESEKDTYYLVAEVKDERGNTVTCSSRPLNFYPGKDLIGKKVTVCFMNRHINEYEMEIDRIL
ncbi:MAG: hypothetical protein IKE59_05920 [Erysipelotrichaceae bacterium]|nr:hypothetical protein [Erysipelotrichaceae bacterium]